MKKANLALFINQLQQQIPLLHEQYQVKSLGLFGSYVRQEQRLDSDLDVLVTFHKPIGLFKFMELENYLTDILGVKVDLVMEKGLKPRIGQQILAEVVRIDDSRTHLH